MPKLDAEDLARLQAKPTNTCSDCGETVRKNYCQSCDEFYEAGHARSCPTLEGGVNDHDRSGHRPY